MNPSDGEGRTLRAGDRATIYEVSGRPDRDEALAGWLTAYGGWHGLKTDRYLVVGLDPREIWRRWSVDGEALNRLYRRTAIASQRRLVAEFRGMVRRGDDLGVIVVAGVDPEDAELLDGFHRVAAWALEGVGACLALDLGQPEREVE